jgi:hypothetical protein
MEICSGGPHEEWRVGLAWEADSALNYVIPTMVIEAGSVRVDGGTTFFC